MSYLGVTGKNLVNSPMNFEEYVAKPILEKAGILIPNHILVTSPEEAKEAFRQIGCCVIKAQVPVGKRGKSG